MIELEELQPLEASSSHSPPPSRLAVSNMCAQCPSTVRRMWQWARRCLSFVGPGHIVAVGYMDPGKCSSSCMKLLIPCHHSAINGCNKGNYATDIAAGSQFGYALLWIVLFSSLIATYTQILALRLGIVAKKDLAEHCRDHFPRWAVWPLYLLAEVAIVATDMAEVIGSAIAINLLIPS